MAVFQFVCQTVSVFQNVCQKQIIIPKFRSEQISIPKVLSEGNKNCIPNYPHTFFLTHSGEHIQMTWRSHVRAPWSTSWLQPQFSVLSHCAMVLLYGPVPGPMDSWPVGSRSPGPMSLMMGPSRCFFCELLRLFDCPGGPRGSFWSVFNGFTLQK